MIAKLRTRSSEGLTRGPSSQSWQSRCRRPWRRRPIRRVARAPVHELTKYDGDRPVVLLIGSSFTAAGIDPDALPEALASSGRVSGAVSLFENCRRSDR